MRRPLGLCDEALIPAVFLFCHEQCKFFRMFRESPLIFKLPTWVSLQYFCYWNMFVCFGIINSPTESGGDNSKMPLYCLFFPINREVGICGKLSSIFSHPTAPKLSLKLDRKTGPQTNAPKYLLYYDVLMLNQPTQ